MSSMRARVLYDFQAQPGSGELDIKADEIVTVTRQDVGEGWWEGTNNFGQTGLFPAGYVEPVTSPPIPSHPAPQLIQSANSAGSFDNDADWGDDDWDDDDSQASNNAGDTYYPAPHPTTAGAPHTQLPAIPGAGSGGGGGNNASRPPPVRKSFNRFSTFVKSGGEDYILGVKTLHVSNDSYTYIIDSDGVIMWSPNQFPYSCIVASPKKESKMKGLKSYIAYQLTPSTTNREVSRRYKHFDWLYERLQEKFTTIPIPPLPDKQISGRYQEEFIRHRQRQLQSWVDRICRHPVLSQSAVWIHFLECGQDEKRWKAGKRRAEKDELVGASFYFAIQVPSTYTSLDIVGIERQMDGFGRFVGKMDDAVKHLFSTALDQSKKFSGPYRREFSKISNAIAHVAQACESSNVNKQSSNALNEALRHTSNTYEEIGKLYEEQPRNDYGPMADMLHEYKGLLTAWPEILQVHKGAINRKREHQKLLDDGKIDSARANSVYQRADVVTYATLAEINHFQDERVIDVNGMMKNFLTEQMNFYQNIAYKIQETLAMYDRV